VERISEETSSLKSFLNENLDADPEDCTESLIDENLKSGPSPEISNVVEITEAKPEGTESAEEVLVKSKEQDHEEKSGIKKVS
jgi:hypothetical protein